MTKLNDHDIDEYRRRAMEMREAAEATDNPIARAECLMVARAWDDFVAEVVRAGLARASTLN